MPQSTERWRGWRQSERFIRYRAARREAVQQTARYKLYRQIVGEYPDSPTANQGKTRLTDLEKAR